MNPRKRLGVSSQLYCSPLVHYLRTDDAFETLVDSATQNAIALREHIREAALVSPIDYVRESSEYSIIPGIAVSSTGEGEAIVLHFGEGLHNITTLAVDPSSTSEIVLASILLSEQFDVRPTLVPIIGSLNTMLDKADAALLVGDAALVNAEKHRNKLDLVDAWSDLTGLPFVHCMWCCREQDISKGDLFRIQHAKERGVADINTIVSEMSTRLRLNPPLVRQYLEGFTYDFPESVQDGLSEFLRYAYYHGVLPDIPDLHFYGAGDNEDESEPPLSLN